MADDTHMEVETSAMDVVVDAPISLLPPLPNKILQELPKNRFELELEFVQALASPAYLHFLATHPAVEGDDNNNNNNDDDNDDGTGNDGMQISGGGAAAPSGAAAGASSSSSSITLLQDVAFHAFLRYLRDTWSQPAYSRYLSYPHALYFLNLLIESNATTLKEWTLPAFRNFVHQQQFLAWQHRHTVCYGGGMTPIGTTIEMADVTGGTRMTETGVATTTATAEDGGGPGISGGSG